MKPSLAPFGRSNPPAGGQAQRVNQKTSVVRESRATEVAPDLPAQAGFSPAPAPINRGAPVVTHSPEETIAFARELAKKLPDPCWVLLEGDLGSGKTTLAKGLIAGLGAAREEEVTSPTFTLVHEYAGEKKVYHVDLYRIEQSQELRTLGLEDLMSQSAAAGRPATVIVEWAEKLGDIKPARWVTVRLEHLGDGARKITVEGLEV